MGRNSLGQHFGQLALVESENAADAERKAIERQQFGRLNGIAGEAVEHSSRQP